MSLFRTAWTENKMSVLLEDNVAAATEAKKW